MPTSKTPPVSGLILSLGGNALIRQGEEGDIAQQYQHARETFVPLVPLVREHKKILIVHGNGPQVGNELLRSEIASFSVVPLPLDTCVANSQGSMGYMIQQVFVNELRRHRMDHKVVTLITQTLVDENDPAFSKPTKPIGVFYKKSQADRFRKQYGWKLMEDAGRGLRRVVASPTPLNIVEMEAIETLYHGGAVVIAGGGGGIPVVRLPDGALKGVEAVVDKDHVTALIAARLRPKLLVMLTGVPEVYTEFGTTQQKPLRQASSGAMQKLYDANQFSVGAMAPKVRSAINFLQQVPDAQVLITSPESLEAALAGKSGTWIHRD